MPIPSGETKPSVAGLFIGPVKGQPLSSVEKVNAVAGRGLEGDRKLRPAASPPADDGPDRELTLIEAEAIEAAIREYGVQLEAIEARRNVLTRGVALNHLVGRRFKVGAVLLQGIRLCEPCAHLEALTRKGVRKALVHRGGLRAQIVEGGEISLGDPIVPVVSS
ncbi:MAG: MOSC domain-containing protein [Isosphaeraceae bacterium]